MGIFWWQRGAWRRSAPAVQEGGLGMAAFSPEEREAVHRAIFARRDIRHFREDPIPDEAFARLLQAFQAAPSVGLSQPWALVEVHDPSVKERVFASHRAVRAAERERFTGKALRIYDRLRLEGLLQAPTHLAVFQRPVTTTLGAFTMPEALTHSVVLAVGNLWLAARAEGIGVGWVSILEPDRVRTLLGVPEEHRLVAYLCLGYPRAWPKEPLLKTAGWREPEPLVHYRERWGCP